MIKDLLKNYQPFNEQERQDVKFILDCAEKDQILTRDNNMAHLTSSAFIINKKHDKVLAIYHNIYDSWCWVGGHADGEENLVTVAKKEIREETSLKNFKLLLKSPIAIDSLPVMGHYKNGKYVSAHVHLNVTFLFEAEENEAVKIKEDENSNVGWLTFDDLISSSSEPHMVKVYKKITEKLKTENIL